MHDIIDLDNRVSTTVVPVNTSVIHNHELKIVKNLTAIVPRKIRDVLRSINTKLKTTEFSIYVKGKIDWEEMKLHISDDWYFPKQTVAAASVDYDSTDDPIEFNGVIHKHPGKLKTFSATDETFINQNFEFSLIWVDDEWGEGKVNVTVAPGRRIQIPVSPERTVDFDLDIDAIRLAQDKAKMFVAPKQTDMTARVIAGFTGDYSGFGKIDEESGQITILDRMYDDIMDF